MKLLIRAPNWIGDAVMATPVFSLLRKKYPSSSIAVLAKPHIIELLQHDPSIDSFIPLKRDLVPFLQANYCDAEGLLLTNSFSSALLFYKGKVKNRIGFSTHHRTFLLNTPLQRPLDEHQIIEYQRLLQPFDIEPGDEPPALFLHDEEKVQFPNKTIGIHAFAAYGAAKCWPLSSFRQLAEQIADSYKDVDIIFFGDAKSHQAIEKTISGLPRTYNLAGKTSLRELIASIDATSLFISNDSGPMHIASALGKPLIALFGSTNSKKTGPYQATILEKHVSCAPCMLRRCPIDFRCMRAISVDEVFQSIKDLLC